ncbi:sigma-70 family RNA polymerase sigma factor [Leptospira levettii]|uniref:Sigma-70 family RNA polymerase sigma factor n=1 Tax=Leptospira levettii TaxID=2023178 RepID=A0AAW5V431_9LEPT|nr:sigma-70 family RNA polymerase sigma factor [Leptospira levettii]PKA24946.1 RNA polymerase subunit sigma [Leptospira sp. mixed culture ATI2-C-A1]MCW7464425.1 sigma-70 family RNA polymerase sigma factor [Leptospira levettii]MCW7495506.1 sigma-70 family RNA polymerase sigma factor [Leptospira levettii]MCW7511390.1 sigma-70 family RNA polymerase sigma factor [Leptospira levettii]MCW7515145.1 sigma-70 family RNA polymerase sigma factor [Leptospira levettii]
MENLQSFLEWKPYLFSIAYRITGSYADAEDILQESYLRWLSVDHTKVENPKAYLGSIVARLAFDLLKKASRKRETYIGPYLPEPIPEFTSDIDDEKINFAFLVLLETLNPFERAVFLLRESFGFEFELISKIIGKSPEYTRKILSRAKQALKERRKKFDPDPKHQEKLLMEFSLACIKQDTKSLSQLLKEDVVAYSDGGGKVHAARIPIPGIIRVITFLKQTIKKVSDSSTVYFGYANGSPVTIGYGKDGFPNFVQFILIEGNQISEILTITNPDKLKGFQNKDQLRKLGYIRKPKYFHLVYLWIKNKILNFGK